MVSPVPDPFSIESRNLNIDRSPLKPATETVEKARVCLLSGLRQEDACPGGRVERFLSGTAPEETCSWHRRIEVDEFGALATGCPNTQERLAIRWPGEFAEWAHKQDLPSWPTTDHSCTEKMDTPAAQSGSPRNHLAGVRQCLLLGPKRPSGVSGHHIARQPSAGQPRSGMVGQRHLLGLRRIPVLISMGSLHGQPRSAVEAGQPYRRSGRVMGGRPNGSGSGPP